MAYLFPSRVDLAQLAYSDLYHGKNPARKDAQIFIRRAAAIDPIDNKSLLGAFTFVLEQIKSTYKHLSPTKSHGFLYSTGSELYTKLEFELNRYGCFSDAEKLIALSHFYEFLKSKSENEIKTIFHKKKQILLNEAHFLLKRICRRERKRIEMFTHGLPKLEALQSKIKKLIPEYKEATSLRWFSNYKRTRLVDFINFINDTIEIYKADSLLLTKELKIKLEDCEDKAIANQLVEKLKDERYIHEYNVSFGLNLFVLNRIEREYNCLSPERSMLFQRLKEALNKNLKDLTHEEKDTWLRGLSVHLKMIQKETKLYGATLEKWKAKGIRLDEFSTKIDEYILEEGKVKDASKMEQLAKSATNYSAQVGASFAITEAVSRYALPAIGSAVVGGTLGPIGVVIYGAAGTILMTQVGRLVTDNLIPPFIAYLYTWISIKIGSAIANTVVGTTTLTYTFTKKGWQKLMGHPALTNEDRECITEWVNTLLILPNDIISAEDKEQIKYVLDIEEPYLKEEAEKTVPMPR